LKRWGKVKKFQAAILRFTLMSEAMLSYYYPPEEPVNTLVMTCPSMEMMRLWPFLVERMLHN
jgi:hypothetical protein